MMSRSILWTSLLVVGVAAFPATEDVANISRFFTSSNTRVFGGSAAAPGSAPYMVGLNAGLLFRSHLCGGAVITSRHVLTAAHCIDHVYFNDLMSTLRGTVGTNYWNTGGVSYSFSRNISHPHYVASTIKNDIAILITTTAITFGPTVSPAALNFAHMDGGEPVKLTGWGISVTGGGLTNPLQELYTTIVDSDTCIAEMERATQVLGWNFPLEPHIELCSFHSIGHGACSADSGGPLIGQSGGVVGVVAWAVPCAQGYPDVYARVSGFREWLLSALMQQP